MRAVGGPARHEAVRVDEARGEALAVRDGVVEPEHAQVEVAARRGPVGEVDRRDGDLATRESTPLRSNWRSAI